MMMNNSVNKVAERIVEALYPAGIWGEFFRDKALELVAAELSKQEVPYDDKTDEAFDHFLHTDSKEEAGAVLKWKCACGWRGSHMEMGANPSGSRLCPSCHASGGLLSDLDRTPQSPETEEWIRKAAYEAAAEARWEHESHELGETIREIIYRHYTTPLVYHNPYPRSILCRNCGAENEVER